MPKGYDTYRYDTRCGGDTLATVRTIRGMTTWYARAKRRMKELEITQEDLIPLFRVSTRGAVGHYLSGRRDPPSDIFPALADRLGLSLDDLLRGPPPKTHKQVAAGDSGSAADDAGKWGDYHRADPHVQRAIDWLLLPPVGRDKLSGDARMAIGVLENEARKIADAA